MPTNSVRIHAANFPQISVTIHAQFWLALDAHKFSKDSCGKIFTFSIWLALETHKFSKDSCGKMSAILTKKDSVVLLVEWTLSIRESLCIWYSLQFTLHLRGATPTNRHPLKSCGFSREILWHSCLEVVMNFATHCKEVSINYIWTHIWKYFICGFVRDFGISTVWKLKEYERTIPLSDRSYFYIHSKHSFWIDQHS